MRTPEQLLKLVCQYLNDAGVDYVVVGGFAVMFHGRPRTTADLDFVISIENLDIQKFVNYLIDQGLFASVYDMEKAFEEGSHCSVEDQETLFRLDIKKANGPFDIQTLENRIAIQLDDIDIYLATAEDTIVNKLAWGRPIDLFDALGVYTRQEKSLDIELIMKMCQERDMVVKWEAFVKAAKTTDDSGLF